MFLYAFDLLELDGIDLRRETIEVRKEALASLLHSKGELGLQLNEHFHEAGDVIFRHACKLGCEGIVSKRLRVALSVWAVARLAQDEEPGSTGSEAGGRRGLGRATVTLPSV